MDIGQKQKEILEWRTCGPKTGFDVYVKIETKKVMPRKWNSCVCVCMAGINLIYKEE